MGIGDRGMASGRSGEPRTRVGLAFTTCDFVAFPRRLLGWARWRCALPSAPPSEVRAAQKLRYRVFFEEGGAIAPPNVRLIRRDLCRFDRVRDHLIVVDVSAKTVDRAPRWSALSPSATGRCRLPFRLLQREGIRRRRADCTPSRQALCRAWPLVRRGRLPRPARARAAVAGNLGLCAAPSHRRDVRMREFPRRGPEAPIPPPCALLRGEARRPSRNGASRRSGRGGGGAAGGSLPPDARAALRALPPLIKGYWRLGAKFSRSGRHRSDLWHDRRARGVADRGDRVALSRAFRAPRRDAARLPRERVSNRAKMLYRGDDGYVRHP